MKRPRRRNCRLSAAVSTLSILVAACSGDSSGGASVGVPEYQGGLPPTSADLPGGALEGSGEEGAEVDPALPSGEAPVSTNEGENGDIALEPPGDTETPGTEEAPAPEPEDTTPEILPKFVGNITTGNSVDTNGLTFSDHWDQITPENAGKWGSVQRTADSALNWAALDAIYDYTEQSGVIFKEHTFVWGAQQPTGDLTEAHVRSWMSEFCTRYPNTRLIDVVNEPPPHTEPSYAEAIGGGTDGDWRWIANAFTWAREYCPNAVLILNDFNNIEFGNQSQHFIDIVHAIQELGAPVDALGAQAHGLSGANSTATMIELLTKLHDDTGLPVYITEYDINQEDDAAQLDRFQQQFPFFMETEWIHGVTVWGWILGRTWVESSGLIRDGASRPAMVWLMEELGRPAPP
jgi:endo-1,4-beta-xylanase